MAQGMNQASMNRKKRRAQASRTLVSSNQEPLPAQSRHSLLNAWLWSGAAVLVAAAVLRLVYPTLKPLHHDEGVNGLFLLNLFRTGYYHYDPANYHGPTLYYFAWITTTINSFFYGREGLSTAAIRLVPALFGVGVIWLLLCLRRQLGTFGALSAAALAAVSPGMVYFSRYFIHEILFVFFSLGVVVAVLRFRETRRPLYLMLGSASAALMGATKETWIIAVAVWLIALPCTAVYVRWRKALSEEATASRQRLPENARRNSDQAPPWSKWRLYATAAAIFVALWVLFYSSFFTNFPQGLLDSVRTFGYWFTTSGSAHGYSWTKYFQWLGQEELPALTLGSFGIVIALGQARSRFAVFTAFWSMGILAAYCLVPYKTPWCALNIILPFAIMAGFGLEQLYQQHWLGRGAALIALAAVAVSLFQAIDVSFFRYDDDTRAYVYAHTQRDFLLLVKEIDSIAKGNPAGNNIGIAVMSPEHWPLPWYLRNYTHVGYWGKVIDTSDPILIVHENQIDEVERSLGSKYRRISSHDLRPGNRLFLYLRKDLQP